MTFHVTVLTRARADAESIYEWIGKRSPRGAVAWYEVLATALQSLAVDAETAGSAPESDFVHVPLRQRLFHTRRGRRYRLIFTLTGNEVRVLRVRGPGQAPLTKKDLPDQ